MAASTIAATAEAGPFPSLNELITDAHTYHHEKKRHEARARVRANMPPIPEMRFEQAYLRSVMPAIHTREQGGDKRVAIALGRPVWIDWGMASWITVRDQILSPFLQGAFWGLLSITAGGATAALRSTFFSSGHRHSDRIAGAGDARSLRRSAGGGVETNLSLQ